MNIKLARLVLNCRQSVEEIDLSAQISFFDGKISAGKSSIVRLIDFCLGGNLERTPAISAELVSVSLHCQIERYEVVLDREAKGSNQIQVTWRGNGLEPSKVLAPLQAMPGRGPIWAEDIFTFSDLIFWFVNITPIRVRRSKGDAESPLVRLSFRDLLFYCYLEQDHIDSSFFNMEDPFKKLKSRDVMRFVVGFYTEQLTEMEMALEELQESRSSKLQAAEQLRQTLKELGYGSVLEIQAEISQLRDQLKLAQAEELNIRSGQIQENHLVDELRERLRGLASLLGDEEQAYEDQQGSIQQLDRLKAEFISTRFKLGRAEAASAVLANSEFQCCPRCGVPIDNMTPRPAESAFCAGHQIRNVLRC
jgi:hypothetical protein